MTSTIAILDTPLQSVPQGKDSNLSFRAPLCTASSPNRAAGDENYFSKRSTISSQRLVSLRAGAETQGPSRRMENYTAAWVENFPFSSEKFSPTFDWMQCDDGKGEAFANSSSFIFPPVGGDGGGRFSRQDRGPEFSSSAAL